MKALRLIASVLAAGPVLTAVPVYAAADSAFPTDALKGDNSEVTAGKDEANSAQSPRVKKLAQAPLPTLNKHLAACAL